MATRTALRPPSPGAYAHLEPLPDPPRIPDMQQYDRLVAFDSILRAHFAARTDVLISGQGYLRHEAGNDAERLAPDCVVAFGVNSAAIVARNGYVISEVGQSPDFVLEMASQSTGQRDYTVKRAGYAGYGVREYWRFDHTGGRYHDAPLAGDRLVAGEYEPLQIHEEAGGLKCGHSPVLGLDLCWDEGQLRVYDPAAGVYLPTAPEWSAQHAAERAARLTAEDRAATERAARLSVETELRRLRERLRRLQAE
ncbi:MAG: Uma2 family endonuclease [Chloroflexota bacterium]|nr:Uma2 family endonuclease [Chloroflexota bacterium]